MQSLMIQSAGGLAIVIAIIHSVLGETHVFNKAAVQPVELHRLVHLLWHAPSVDWIAFGALLIAAPMLLPASAQSALVLVGAAMYGYAALTNAIATNGKHFGWMLLALVVALLLGSLVV
jgi:hypothetical protein